MTSNNTFTWSKLSPPRNISLYFHRAFGIRVKNGDSDEHHFAPYMNVLKYSQEAANFESIKSDQLSEKVTFSETS